MMGFYRTPRVARMVAGVVLAAGVWLSCASVAGAQTSAQVQYGELASLSGPAAGVGCSMLGLSNDDGLFNAGDSATFPGDYTIAPGSSVIVDDMDGTQGTFIDGQNATITESSIMVRVTGDPIGVAGGNGVLNDTVCNSIVATTGIAAAGPGGTVSGDAERGSVVGVLPDTGGWSLLWLLGGLASVGTGVVLVRRLALARANRAA